VAHPNQTRWLVPVALSITFRVSCWVGAAYVILFAEARAAPSLPDAVLELVPYVGWVDRYNYLAWLAAYLPVALALLRVEPGRFCRYMVTSGLLALVRAACILATGLGPVRGADVNAGMNAEQRWNAFVSLVTPTQFFSTEGASHVYLTKDLFFSGHTATTLLLLLYVWPFPKLRWWMLAGHLLIVASVFLSHLLYTIDVVGAYAITFALFAAREWPVRRLLESPPAPLAR